MECSVLSHKEEADLFRRCKDGDMEAFCRLVLHNMGLVRKVAARFVPLQTLPELFSHGILGLIKAIRKYDERRGSRFSTYAVKAIEQAISRGVRETAWMIKLSAYATRALREIGETADFAGDIGDGEPAVMANGSLSPRRRRTAILAGFAQRPRLLDDTSCLELLPDPNALNPFINIERMDTVRLLLGCLSERECDVIKRRFGLECPEETQKEIGRSYGIGEQSIAKIEADALRKMRERAVSLSMI
ncbi:MAG: sigma-70 family RNA polymerase sigma factor [Patescibacteria group bacterium]